MVLFTRGITSIRIINNKVIAFQIDKKKKKKRGKENEAHLSARNKQECFLLPVWAVPHRFYANDWINESGKSKALLRHMEAQRACFLQKEGLLLIFVYSQEEQEERLASELRQTGAWLPLLCVNVKPEDDNVNTSEAYRLCCQCWLYCMWVSIWLSMEAVISSVVTSLNRENKIVSLLSQQCVHINLWEATFVCHWKELHVSNGRTLKNI